jgi:hypothetical protein
MTGGDGRIGLRRLGIVSMLMALASLLATAGGLSLLPYSGPAGQWVLGVTGGAAAFAAFAFGRLVILRRAGARRVGFVAAGMAVVAAVLFGLLALARPEAGGYFVAFLTAEAAYAAFVSRRLAFWPSGEIADEPRASLGIFLSYRRDDSRESVGRIHDHLCQAFDPARIFLDVERQAPGADYRAVIGRALDQAEVVLVVIGPAWLTLAGADGRRRIDDAEDMVRLEVEMALARDQNVVPLLVQGATMPSAAQLPAALGPLAYLNALPVRPDPDFHADVLRLVAALRAQAQAAGCAGAPGVAARRR